MVNTTGERREALREALVAAAEQHIAAQGYNGLRARALADDVGCALGAIYTVFPDLDALMTAVKGRVLARLDANFAAEGAERAVDSEAARHLLHRLADRYLAFAVRHKALWRLLFEHRTSAPELPDWFAERREALFAHIEQPLAVLLPDAPTEARAAFARGLFGAVHGIVTLGLEEKLGAVSVPLVARQVEAVVEAALTGVSARPDILAGG